MKIKLAILFPCLININNIWAGGFQMHEQNASLGDVHAGHSVITNDASIGFYNPAGLIEILSPKATNSAVTVANNLSFRGKTVVSTNPSPDPANYPPLSSEGKVTTSGTHVIPALHFATPINNRFAFGLSVASPFAAELAWSQKAFTRFNTTQNGIKTINFSPSLAFKLNNEFAVGFGPEIQYVDMQINKIVGTSYDYTFQGQVPSSFDSKVTNNLTNTDMGWHAGLLWTPSNNFKFGYSYRAKIEHKAHGESKLKGKLAGSFEDFSSDKENKSKKLKATIRIPASMAFSAEYKPSSDISLVSSVIYTQWDIVQSFNLENVPTAFVHPDNQSQLFLKLVSARLGFRNTFTILNGVHWKYNNKLLLKTGLGYDQTPSNNSYRDLKMPDGNRILLGLGANYNYSKNLNFEAGYMFVKVQETKISNTAVIPAADIPVNVMNPGEINHIHGKASGYAHLFGVQFTLNAEKVMQYFI